MTPYQYVHNNPIMFTDPTGMSAEGGGGGLWSKLINGARSFLGVNSDDRPNAQYADDGSEILNEIVISGKRKNLWSRLASDWKNIKENSGYNHFVNWFKNQKYDGGFYLYDDDGKAKGDQSLRKRANPTKPLEAINVGGFVQAASFSKGGEGIKYDIEDVKTAVNVFNNVFSGLSLGNGIPESKVQVDISLTKWQKKPGESFPTPVGIIQKDTTVNLQDALQVRFDHSQENGRRYREALIMGQSN